MTLLPGRIRRLAALSLTGALACGGSAARSATGTTAPGQAATAATSAGSLNRFAAERVMVLPAQSVSGVDPLGWRARAGDEQVLLRRVDSTLAAQLGERGLTQWAFTAALVRAARRNPTYVTDPYQVRALGAIRAAMRSREQMVLEPVSSQLRALAGVSDARWALVPLEVAFVGDDAGGHVALSMAIVDVRGTQVRWSGSVAGARASDYSFAAVESAIHRAADLVVPRD
ncbi:MAG: hypothetical protein IT361_08865 [Gemmatimonadaceae bacterium]|nr:hypothetical protein [Gemmatimonadaceae bacterium]